MKKKNVFTLLLASSLIGASAFTLALSNKENKTFNIVRADDTPVGDYTSINVVNCADYIYIQDPENGYDEPDLVDQFIDYAQNDPSSPFYGKRVNVSYSTSDTPESMYNEVKTGKTRIDLVCPSDYMIQKMLGEGMLAEIDRSLVPNYQKYCSPKISAYLDNIEAKHGDQIIRLEDYCVGYMWGTLGILFNPTYDNYKIEVEGQDEMSEEELAEAKYQQMVTDLRHYSALWNKQYDGTISIKNSIRDTLAVVDLKHHEEQLLSFRKEYLDGTIDAQTYNEKINSIFNLYSTSATSDAQYKFDSETRNAIYNELLELKGNIFGLEVDSGKNDIVTGKIGINLAWSGDAVYAMEQAYNYDETELLYSVPEEGANVWFDGWVMPKNNNRTNDQRLLAHLFLDYLSNPETAAKNMDYIGYTSFIAGDDILALVRDWYDYRTDEMIYTYEYKDDKGKDQSEDLDIYVKTSEGYRPLDYPDFVKDSHDQTLDDEKLYYEFDEEYHEIIDEDENGNPVNRLYQDLIIVDADDSELFAVDLSYFFSGTLSDEYEEADMIFYAEDYYVDCDDENPDGLAVGGDFYCQYPDEETIIRCCIMQDFGENNRQILELWEDFKSGEFPTWAIILLIVEVGTAAAVATYILMKKKISKDHRKKRKMEAQNK